MSNSSINQKLAARYPWIVKYHNLLGSFAYYINDQLEVAEAANAPQNTTSVRQEDGAYKITTTDSIKNLDTRRILKLPIPEMPRGMPLDEAKAVIEVLDSTLVADHARAVITSIFYELYAVEFTITGAQGKAECIAYNTLDALRQVCGHIALFS